MKNVDIVVISWAKNDELRAVTQNCLDTLYASETNVRFHPYIVEQNPAIEYNWGETLHPAGAFGYNKYCNFGRKQGKSPYVALCNNDIIFHPGWATVLLSAMEQFPQFVSMSPWCPRAYGEPDGKKGTLIEGYLARQQVSGWCIFQKREIYDVIGDLDEEFVFWYSDNDYGMTLVDNDLRHCLVPDAVVEHLGGDAVTGLTVQTLDDAAQNEFMNAQKDYVVNKWKEYTRMVDGKPAKEGDSPSN